MITGDFFAQPIGAASVWSIMKMKGCLAIGLVGLAVSAWARTGSYDGYEQIPKANIFRLKPYVAPVVTPAPPPAPPKILLQGIVNAWGRKQVLFSVKLAARPGEAAKESSFTLSEGEGQGQVVVLEIDAAAGTVKFINHGEEQLLSLANDSLPQNGQPAKPAVSIAAQGVGQNTPKPTIMVAQAGLEKPKRELSHEEQMILMEINSKLTRRQVEAGEMPPLPPTGLSP